MLIGLIASVSALVLAPGRCATAAWTIAGSLQLALVIVVILGFGLLASLLRSTALLVCIQAAVIILLALVHWFLLAGSGNREADGVLYRHVFAFWAPSIMAVLLLAPLMAAAMFRARRRTRSRSVTAPQPASDDPDRTTPPSPLSDPDNLVREARAFRTWLTSTELFANRPHPVLNGRRLAYALFYGPFYHPLHLLLLPALMALVVPPTWLYVTVISVFVVSLLLLTWGNMAARWDEMNVQVERWFLRGGPLFVSVLVIVLGVLRVLQFDYIATIIDALPFGTIFGMIVMTYVLFWTVEYWLNRVVAIRLLRVLRPRPRPGERRVSDELSVPYDRSTDVPSGILVLKDGRYVVSHGTGRFMAVGTGTETFSSRYATSSDMSPVAFNSFNLTELFSRLGEQAQTGEERGYFKDIERRTGNYFFSLNIVMLAVTAAFIVYFADKHIWSNNGIDPVVATVASPQAGGPADLSALLTKDLDRPAVVVVGSGGGTRAALYTESVLHGLHRLGVDRDIVLLSGVSGGGVALAYFAAFRDELVAAPPDNGDKCPNDFGPSAHKGHAWNCFNAAMTKPFIEDVLNGATEWRVFSRTALSKLLAESFHRRLFGDRRLAAIVSPALILNATIVSHPAEASDLLARTLDPLPRDGADQALNCGEAERTFRLLSGGRLVFTNVRDTTAFPRRPARIPDVELPYEIMQADGIPLATAAALNANFPPVFPAARVRVTNAAVGGCPARSYYVTDGGAVENLGLISALYALQSAIGKLPAGTPLRPIHIVLAEASAISYDYGQDRGLSALSGSRERLAGGLTETLLDNLEHPPKNRERAIPQVKWYYLGLPLAFRARGGFGTHWMYADQYHLNDPRQRSISRWNFLPFSWSRDHKALVDHEAIRALWLALHDPDTPFCDAGAKFKGDTRKVHGWICGADGDRNGRDLHMAEWAKLVNQMRAVAK